MARAMKRISNNKKRKVETLLANAEQALLAGRADICEAMCREVERLWPGNPDVLNLRGVMAAQGGDLQSAERCFQQAVEAAPRRFEFVRNLGSTRLRLGKHAGAVAILRQAMTLNGRDAGAALNLANALKELGRHDEAHAVLLDALPHAPRHVDVLLGLAAACFHLKRYDESMQWTDKALAIDPDRVEALLRKAYLLRDMGDLEGAEHYVREVLAREPHHADAAFLLADVKRFRDPADPDLNLLREAYAHAKEGSEARKDICFGLGRALEGAGLYDEAFRVLAEGNEIARRATPYDADAALGHMERIMEAWTPVAARNTGGLDDARPVFIVGMPRCGSTLTEQILAAHPQVAARGETGDMEVSLAEWERDAGEKLTLERITAFSPEEWDDIGNRYLARMAADIPEGPGGALRVTDKSLANIRLIGAIHCALPEARIIHVRRHPLDLCWSNFKADLVSDEFAYNYSLGSLGYYCRMYMRLMAHWRDVLPGGVMLELDYEDLVADQEGQVRRLLDFIGLEWDDACLQFQRVDRVVLTSSVAQVRRGLYRDAVQRWRHYERHLEPLIRILGAEGWPD